MKFIATMVLILSACSHAPSDNGAQNKTEVEISKVDSAPLSYDELQSQFADQDTVISEQRINALYREICGPHKWNKLMDYSKLNAEELLRSYQKLNSLSELYKDSSTAFLEVFENQLKQLEVQHDTLTARDQMDIKLHLKISETKSDIFSHFSELRMKKIQHD